MSINKYVVELETVIHSYSIITNYNLNIDRKTEEIVFISGQIFFRNNSTLDFKEFVEWTDDGIEKYKS